MRKFILGFVIAVVICGIAFSETSVLIDFSDFSDDELLATRDRLDLEVNRRGLTNCSLLYLGSYVVGEDLKAGSYDVFFTSREEYGWLDISSFLSEQDFMSWYNEDHKPSLLAFHDTLFDYGTGVHLRLKDGQVLFLSGSYSGPVFAKTVVLEP